MPNGRGYEAGETPASLTWRQIAAVLRAGGEAWRFADALDAVHHVVGDDYTREAFEVAATSHGAGGGGA
jgi:hypothetical protein